MAAFIHTRHGNGFCAELATIARDDVGVVGMCYEAILQSASLSFLLSWVGVVIHAETNRSWAQYYRHELAR